jgi:hypothetical protein
MKASRLEQGDRPERPAALRSGRTVEGLAEPIDLVVLA